MYQTRKSNTTTQEFGGWVASPLLAKEATTRAYSGVLSRPHLEEAYLLAHLSNQALTSTFAAPGQAIQFASTTGRANTLVILGHADEQDVGWRVLADNRSIYVIFRGSTDWSYCTHETRLFPINIDAHHTFNVHGSYLSHITRQLPHIIVLMQQNRRHRVVLAGHGNGGALAQVAFLKLLQAGFQPGSTVAGNMGLMVYAFGSPLIGTPAEPRRPLASHFIRNVLNFVVEDDPMASLLGQKDFGGVDTLLGPGHHLRKPHHSHAEIRAFRPLGTWFHLRSNQLFDITPDKLIHLLDVRRGGLPLAHRLAHHNPVNYVALLRNVVTEN
eukprot:TRINITY_DN54470_c0_g1_i1.p1 TRINITY_DN54470_c0_g1~~TRINITY_DN54470_c0_g1_i1.p1  ORF type:complete len:327 (+),score=29.04 TRINITY_DN54470_c0_g1_i1:382-1362(+)